MTAAREISAERLKELRRLIFETDGVSGLLNEEGRDLLAHIAWQQAALEAASAEAERLAESYRTVSGAQRNAWEAFKRMEARATASEAEAARLLGVQGLLRTNLERVTEHLESWRRGSPTEATSETDAALWCARQVLKALAPPGVSVASGNSELEGPFEPPSSCPQPNQCHYSGGCSNPIRDCSEPPPAPAPEPASTEAWLAACIVFPTDGPKALQLAHALDQLRGRG